jgi:hypothetical protein
MHAWKESTTHFQLDSNAILFSRRLQAHANNLWMRQIWCTLEAWRRQSMQGAHVTSMSKGGSFHVDAQERLWKMQV